MAGGASDDPSKIKMVTRCSHESILGWSYPLGEPEFNCITFVVATLVARVVVGEDDRAVRMRMYAINVFGATS